MATRTVDVNQRPENPVTSPLFPHRSGQWAKKIGGRTRYFGSWRVPDRDRGLQVAERHYFAVAEDLHAGRAPQAVLEGLTVRELLNAYLHSRQERLDQGELRPATIDSLTQYFRAVLEVVNPDVIADSYGPRQFAELRARLAKRYQATRLGNVVSAVRGAWKWGYNNEMLDKAPRFGDGFTKPPMRVRRRIRRDAGERMFEAEAIRTLLDMASVPMRAMILLGVNAGWGNTDIGEIPRALWTPLEENDDAEAILHYPRPKTEIDRRSPLWPETIEALRAWSEVRRRREPVRRARPLLFITERGLPWVERRQRDDGRWVTKDAVTQQFRKLVARLPEAQRPPKGTGFYGLRHTFETAADEVGDEHAKRRVMGHTMVGMAGVYIERISDKRLWRVVNHVRRWLFGETPEV